MNPAREVILDAPWKYVEGVAFSGLSDREKLALRRVADVEPAGPKTIRLGRKASGTKVGRARTADLVVTVPPRMAPNLFVTFFLFAEGLDARQANRPAATVGYSSQGPDAFLALLARLMIQAAERAATIRVARRYVRFEDPIRTVRGTPLWARNFGRHPAEGLTQRFFELLTDNDLNRLILQGVQAAAGLLAKTEARAAAGRELFVWRGIASSVVPGPGAYDRAERSLDSLTEHYRLPLALSRALVVGESPEDVLSGTDGALQTLDFDLATLFERLVYRLVAAAATRLGLRVVPQAKDRRALLDATGALYREVRPDLVVYRGEMPVGVIDAKFKPRYVEGAEAEVVPRASRASNADIYQLFFYQARLQARYSLSKPPPAVIVAPLELEGSTWDAERRTINWPGTAEAEGRLEILPLSLPTLLTAIESGADPVEALAISGDLSATLDRWAA